MSDPTKLKKAKELNRRDILLSMARRANSHQLFFGSSDFKVYDVDPMTDKPEPQELGAHNSYVTGTALAGKYLITGAYDRKLIWWDLEKRNRVRAADAHARWLRGVVAAPDEKTIASVADDMVCRLWDVESGKLKQELKGHAEKTPHNYPSMLYACAFSPDGKHLATGDRVGHIVVWEVATGKEVKTLEAPVMYTWDPRARRHSIGGIRSLAFSPDGKSLAVGGMGKVGNIDHLGGKARVEIFDWQKGEQTHEFGDFQFKGLVEHLAFHHESKWLLAAGGDHNGFLAFFDLKTKKPLKEEKAPMHIHELALDETSDTIYGVGHGKIAVWDLKG